MATANQQIKQELTLLVKQALLAPCHTNEDKQAIEQILANIATLLSPFLTLASKDESKGTATTTGVALDPMGAINCFISYRTVVFWKGLLKAIEDQQITAQTAPIQIVDLGCGPFAALTLPITTQLSCDTIKINLVDIHHSSIASVNRLIKDLELEEYFDQIYQEDAAHYKHPKEKPLHIAVSETMYQALEKEGQVAIFHNIEPQLTPKGLLIPEKIQVDLAWLNPIYELSQINQQQLDFSLNSIKNDRYFKARLFELSRRGIRDHKAQLNRSQDKKTIHCATLQVSKPQTRNIAPFLTTHIQVYKEHIIDEYENGLTYPKALALELSSDRTYQIECSFIIGASPGFDLVKKQPSEKIE